MFDSEGDESSAATIECYSDRAVLGPPDAVAGGPR